MKVIIVEDEYAASKNLISILNEINPDIEVLAVLESVKSLLAWLRKNESPTLGFFDIQLSDDNVFEIFKHFKVDFPVVFTTAYSEYSIKAFKVNSIDYILKPLSLDAVKFAIDKYNSLDQKTGNLSEEKLRKILQEFNLKFENNYKKSFLVYYKDRYIPVETSSFSFFYIDNGIVYGVTEENKRYLIDNTLDEIENSIDPEFFRRVSRQHIVNRKSIKEITLYFSGRYSLKVSPASPVKIIMSKSKSSQIRKWLEN